MRGKSLLREVFWLVNEKEFIRMYLSKSTKLSTPSVSQDINYGLGVRRTSQCGFVRRNSAAVPCWVLIVEEAQGGGVRIFGNSVSFTLSFAVNLKLL